MSRDQELGRGGRARVIHHVSSALSRTDCCTKHLYLTNAEYNVVSIRTFVDERKQYVHVDVGSRSKGLYPIHNHTASAAQHALGPPQDSKQAIRAARHAQDQDVLSKTTMSHGSPVMRRDLVRLLPIVVTLCKHLVPVHVQHHARIYRQRSFKTFALVVVHCY
jgi:hypothetical protein